MVGEMQPVDCIRSTAICVFFLVIGFGKQATYLKGDFLALAASSFGCLCFPEVLLETDLDVSPDTIHVLYMRLFGCVLLTLTVLSYLLREAEDDNVTTGLMISRVLAGGVLLGLGLNTIRHLPPGTISIQALTGSLMTSVLWFTCHLYQLVTFGKSQYGYWNPNVKLDSLTRFIMLDAALGFLQAFWGMTYPDLGVSAITMKGFKPDEIHLMQYQQIGAMNLAVALLSLAAVSFSDEDKKKVLLAKVIFLASLSTTGAVYYWLYGIVTCQRLCFMCSVHGFWGLICLAGYYSKTKA